MTEGHKLNVLLIAFQCAPEGGSVSMIGWHWVQHLHPHVRLHLVTHIRHQRELAPLLDPAIQVTYIDTEWISAPLYRIATRLWHRSQHLLFMVSNIDFLLFGHQAMRLLKPLARAGRFDLCHVVTPVTPVAPHRFGRLGLPTFLGPLNGGLPMLKGFPEIGAEERAWLYRLRFLPRLASKVFGTFRDARVIFSASRSNDKALGHKLASKAYRMCENGVDAVADRVPDFPCMPPKGPLELVFVGRLIPVKGVAMLIEALTGDLNCRLRIVGSGPLEADLRSLVTRLGLDEKVRFLGWLKSGDLPAVYRASHLNVLPSVRESGGATLLEAMAEGRASIALDQGGPAEYIAAGSGILLPCHSKTQVIADFRATFKQLSEEPARIVAMAEASLQRVREHYTWRAKTAEILKVYAKHVRKGERA